MKLSNPSTCHNLLSLTTFIIAASLSSLVYAATPFAGATSTLSNDILTLIAPLAGIGLIAVGVTCWFGKISWYWFGGMVVGIVLVFGNSQIVSWIRGVFSI